jgi:hypothetical protein
MSEREDGGSAFLHAERDQEWDERPARYNDVYHWTDGMTLRDYFAAKAMSAWLTGSSIHPAAPIHDEGEKKEKLGRLAAMSFAVADAMIEARKS